MTFDPKDPDIQKFILENIQQQIKSQQQTQKA